MARTQGYGLRLAVDNTRRMDRIARGWVQAALQQLQQARAGGKASSIAAAKAAVAEARMAASRVRTAPAVLIHCPRCSFRAGAADAVLAYHAVASHLVSDHMQQMGEAS